MLKVVKGLDVGIDPSISNLMANFARDTSRIEEPLQSWDLALVLQGLTKGPFEPVASMEIKWLTFNTIFLITLATGMRRSEVHALRVDTMQERGGGGMIILFRLSWWRTGGSITSY